MSEHAAKDGTSRMLRDQVTDRRLDIFEAAAEVAERVSLEVVDRDRQFRLRSLAECQGPRDEHLGNGVRRDDGGRAAVKGKQQRRGVSHATGELNRFTTQRIAAVARMFVAKCSSEAREKLGPQLGVPVGKRCEALLEEGDDPIVT